MISHRWKAGNHVLMDTNRIHTLEEHSPVKNINIVFYIYKNIKKTVLERLKPTKERHLNLA